MKSTAAAERSTHGGMSSLSDPKPMAAAMALAAKARQRRSSSSMNNATATLRVSVSDIVNVHVSSNRTYVCIVEEPTVAVD